MIIKIMTMTNEEKQLLLQDLCARLHYNPKVKYTHYHKNGDDMDIVLNIHNAHKLLVGMGIYHIKPYLRPMSSMTEDEKKEFIHCAEYEVEESVNGRHYEYYLKDYVGTPEKPICNCNAIDWLNTHHFDYRGLIEKELALPAPQGMYDN